MSQNSVISGRRAKVPELLAPAGTMDAFRAALAAGADAIYCGLGDFNARRNADNLTMESLSRACDLAHVAGARVYVTVNILVGQEELSRALGLMHDAWAAGADAFIIADWGLLSYARQLWPQMELHLSTQANVADAHGVDFAVEQGCSRVTLARELSFQEISACAGHGAELEVFAHGALCVCYSGQCLLSSAQRGRSANRGLCRQPCRLPYRLLDRNGRDVARVEGNRLLSPRDARTVFDLPALAAAGAGALKIEGRMKAPDYVGSVVQSYRAALDLLAEHSDELMSLVEQGSLPGDDGEPGGWDDLDARWNELLPEGLDRRLRRSFNRDFTDGYLRGTSGNELMSYERGNNRGQLVGAVEELRGMSAAIRLEEPVEEGDLLELRSPDRFEDYVTAPCPRDADAGEILEVRLPRRMGAATQVRVIRSERAMRDAREFSSREYPRKRPARMSVVARAGSPFQVRAAVRPQDAHPAIAREASGNSQGPEVSPARTRALTRDDLVEHVGRMGASPYAPLPDWDVSLDDGVGMGFSSVHAVRADALDDLTSSLLAPWHGRGTGLLDAPYSPGSPRWGAVARQAEAEPPQVCALVSTPDQARHALLAGAGRVYALVDDLRAPGSSCIPARPASEGKDGWPEGVVPVCAEVGRRDDLALAERYLVRGEPVATGTVAALEMAGRAGALPEVWDTVELHNEWSMAALSLRGASFFWMSPELDMMQLGALVRASGAPCGITVLGNQRTMTTQHCVLNAMGPCSRTCATCTRRADVHVLVDEFGRESLVTSDSSGRSRLWEPEPLDATPQIAEFLHMGMNRFLVDARLADLRGTEKLVGRAVQALEDALGGRPPQRRLPGHGSGHLFARIG